MIKIIMLLLIIIINLNCLTDLKASEEITLYTIQGSSLSIPVFINEKDESRGIALTTIFDQQVLMPVRGSLTGTTLENDYKIETGLISEGKLSIGVYPFNNKYSINTVACYLQFKVIGTPGLSTTLKFSKFESNNKSVVISENGGFWINGKNWKTINIICRKINLSCIIYMLQTMTGIKNNNLFIDINDDHKTGMQDNLYLLKYLSQL